MSRLSTLDARFEAALGHCLAGTRGRASGWCVALSGGLDSTLLLQALVSLPGAARNLPVRAVHVNHGLHADAADWATSCGLQAAALGVPCEQIVVDARAGQGESPEAAARRARYAAFAAELRSGELLLTAHHADDQLETVMLQWLRGGGLRALSGMPRVNVFAGGWQARPLLEFTRAEIRDWAGALQLHWLEDPSNLDPRFDRNYLRLQVLPAIRRRWPSATKTAQRVADFVADAVDLEEAVAAEELDRIAQGVTLPVAALRELETPRRRAVLRAWLRALGLPVPSAATLAALQRDMLAAAPDRIPCTRWPGARVHRYRDRLFANPEETGPAWRPGPFHAATAGGLRGAPATWSFWHRMARACRPSACLPGSSCVFVPAVNGSSPGVRGRDGNCASGCRSRACCPGAVTPSPCSVRETKSWPLAISQSASAWPRGRASRRCGRCGGAGRS